MLLSKKEKKFLIQYRQKNFKAELIDPPGGSEYPQNDEKVLSVTHNGHQWSPISLTKSEAIQVIKLLRAWL